jgi:hypothetical protein
MSEDRNTIAQSLTVDQLDAFISVLAAKPGKERTLSAIQRAAAEMGITISLMSAKAFRDTTFERRLERMRRAQEVATQVEQIEQGGSTLADASAKLLSKRIFDQLIEAEDDDSTDEVDVEALSLAVSRLRRGNQQSQLVAAALEQAQARLREYEAKDAERQQKTVAAQKALEKLRDPGADISEAERQMIVSKVDEVLGIKVVKKS